MSEDPPKVLGFPFEDEPHFGSPEVMFAACWSGNLDLLSESHALGVDINLVEDGTGLSPLHIAVGSNDYTMCRRLIEDFGARFFPDRFGRWPSLVAIECGAEDWLCAYVAEREENYLAEHPPEQLIQRPE